MSGGSLDDTYGAAFVGLIASAVIYGITLLQTYLYFRNYPNDARFTKILVVFLWFLDTLHLLLCSIALYSYLISNYMNPTALGRSTWSLNLQTDCNGLIGLIVECFFARRVWLLSKNYILTGVIVVLSCLHFGLGILFTVKGFQLVEIAKYNQLIWVTCTGLGSAAAADALIAISLCYYLMKNRTGFARTDSLIAKLIGYSITTGLLTSVIAFLCVVLFAIMPTNYIWLAFFWLIGKFYVNSFLAALNSRDYLREQVAQDGTFLHLTPFRGVVSGQHVEPNGLQSPSMDKAKVYDAERQNQFSDKQALAVSVQTQTVVKADYL